MDDMKYMRKKRFLYNSSYHLKQQHSVIGMDPLLFPFYGKHEKEYNLLTLNPGLLSTNFHQTGKYEYLLMSDIRTIF